MSRNDPQHRRVWPWTLLIAFGLLTTAGGSGGYETLGSLIIAGAITMIVVAVRHNRAVRRALLAATIAAAAAQAAKPGRKQAPAGRPRKTGAGRRAVRKAITLLP
jgi:hypothetical protein